MTPVFAETAIAPGSEVLSDAALRALARAGRQLKPLLGGVDQDIEWALDAQGRVVVLQSRPFIDAPAARP